MRSSCCTTVRLRNEAPTRRCWPAMDFTPGCGRCRPMNQRRSWCDRNRKGTSMASAPGQEPPAELSLAGSVVDKAIEYMIGQKVPPVAIASALLGGSMALLAQSLGDEAIVGILNNAVASVRSGELRGHRPG